MADNEKIVNEDVVEYDMSSSFPDPNDLQYYQDFTCRTFWLDEEIGDSTLLIAKQIIAINRDDFGMPVEEREPIRILINSPGGDLDITRTIVSVIKASQTPVIGINMGLACSGAFYIYLVCHTRLALENAEFLIHEGEGQLQNTYSSCKAFQAQWEYKIDEMKRMICKYSKIPLEVLDTKANNDWYINADEAELKYGLIDKIVTSLDEVYC